MNNGSFSIRIIKSRQELTDNLIDQWRLLENSALENNIYLSPDFILPSLEFLSPKANPIFIFIFKTTEESDQLVFVAIFEEKKLSLRRPFKILASYQSPHSFLYGLLLDKTDYKKTLDVFFDFFSTQTEWTALDFQSHWSNTEQSEQIYASAQKHGLNWIIGREQYRAAILSPNQAYAESILSKNRLKTARRKRTQLQAVGNLEYRLVAQLDSMPEAIHTFLTLEHEGWKGESGSSLLSFANHQQFFSSVTMSLAQQNKVIFSEILLSGKVIASTVNYTSGKAFFAFKTARDEKFDKYSLGILNEIFLIDKLPTCLSEFVIFDSGADSKSHMNQIWKDKLLMRSGYFTKNRFFISCLYIRKLLVSAYENFRRPQE